MQTNKAILRNREIVIFDKKKKKNFAAARVSFFFQPAGSENFLFFFTLALDALFLSTREGHVS